MALSRDDILSTKDLPVQELQIPEWGGSIFVRGITAEERDIFEAALFEDDGKRKNKKEAYRNIRAKLVSLSVCDEKGSKIFNEEDVPKLGKKSAAALDRIFSIAQKLSGMSKTDIEELAKNSVTGPADILPSSSPGS